LQIQVALSMPDLTRRFLMIVALTIIASPQIPSQDCKKRGELLRGSAGAPS
jgi:hypothetical protein